MTKLEYMKWQYEMARIFKKYNSDQKGKNQTAPPDTVRQS